MPQMVLAGPGTGKTRTLIGRIVALLEEPFNIAPENILAVTFTNQATAEMRERLEHVLGHKALRLTVSTIHGFCLKILKKYGEYAAIPKDFIIADDMTQFRLLSRCVNSQDLQSLHHIRNIISQHRCHVKFPLAVDETVIETWVQLYEHQLTKHRMIDYDQILLKAVDLFQENPDILQYYKNKYQAVLIDEFQDIDAIQYAIFKGIVSDHRNIFVVCDEDQGIYSFRGADINIISQFQKDFDCSPDNGIIVLDQNYRSHQALIDLSNELIEPYRLIPKHITAVFEHDDQPQYHECDSDTSERSLILELVEKYHAAGIRYSDIAVLYPTNYLSEMIEPDCITHEIPCRLFASQSLADCDDLEYIKTFLHIIYQELLRDTTLLDADTYDLAYERFVMMVSGITSYTFQLIKFTQANVSFRQAVHNVVSAARNDTDTWPLDITRQECIDKIEFTETLLQSVLDEIHLTEKTIPAFLEVIEKYLPKRPVSLLFACDAVLVDPNSLTTVSDTMGVFNWFLQAMTSNSGITITGSTENIVTIATHMLRYALAKGEDKLLQSIGIGTCVTQDDYSITIRTTNPECTLIFKSGMYEYFKFLQSLSDILVQKKLFQRYIAVDIKEVQGVISSVSLYYIKNGNVEEKAIFTNEQGDPFETFLYSIKHDIGSSKPMLEVLTGNIPIVYCDDNVPVFLKVLFPIFIHFNLFNITAHVTSLHHYYNEKVADVFKRLSFDFTTQVTAVLQEINTQEQVLSRKTALEYLIPLLHFGMYLEYLQEPGTKGVYFTHKSESLHLFLWGHHHFDYYTYDSALTSLYAMHKVSIADFINLFQKDVLLQTPFEQGFSSIMALSLRYADPDILVNLRNFLNNTSLIGLDRLFDIDAVTITTIHAAKGKEWRVGIVAGLEEGILPSTHALRFKAHHNSDYFIDEQRRVLYVALTRIKQHLHLIHTKSRGGRTNRPSRFLQEIYKGV